MGISITNNDAGNVELRDGEFRDDTAIFAGADTYAAGTIMARVTASGLLTPFVIGGAGGAEIPVAVLTYDVERTAAGNEPVRVLVAGTVKRERLIVDADGDGSNLTNAIYDQLRGVGIVPIDTEQLAELDNQ